MNRLVSLLLVLLCATPALVITPSPAEACGNLMHRYKVNPRIFALTKAEYLIRDDRPGEAIEMILGEWLMDELDHDVALIDAGKTERPGRRRALHMLAAAVVRSGGALSRSTNPQPLNGEAQTENLEWALKVLDSVSKSVEEARAYRAEALVRLDRRRDFARQELEALRKVRGLPDAQAWALLAELRRHDDDLDGAIEATDVSIALLENHRRRIEPRNDVLRNMDGPPRERRQIVLWPEDPLDIAAQTGI